MPDLGIAIFMPLGFGLLGGIGFYVTDHNRYGSRIARERIPENVVGVLSWIATMILLGFSTIDQWGFVKPIISMLSMSIMVLMWIVFIVLALRRLQTGKVLLNLGCLAKNQAWASYLLGMIGFAFLALILSSSRSPIEKAEGVSIIGLCWSAGIIAALQSRKVFLITEKGMRTGYTGFQWEEVKYYLWSDEDKDYHYLFFKLKHRPFLMNNSIMKIPEERRQAVRKLITQYVVGDVERLATESSV